MMLDSVTEPIRETIISLPTKLESVFFVCVNLDSISVGFSIRVRGSRFEANVLAASRPATPLSESPMS